MLKSLMVAGVGAGMLLSSTAFAGAYVGVYGGAGPDDGYPPATDYAPVVSTRPLYQTVRVDQPRQECWDQRVAYRDPQYDNNVTAGGLIGALAGGVVGHQFGGGSGRVIATALGAAVGAGVGANIAAQNTPYREQLGYQTQCRTVADSHYEQRIAAYDVTYRYGGRLYSTQMPYDPGDRIAVSVDVSPRPY